jgi:hypothetical protein
LILPLIAVSSAICQADVLQSTVILPPLSAHYTFSGGTCLASLSRCLENASVFGFAITSDTEVSGNELVAVDADFSAGVYTDNGGDPGTLIGTILLTGTMDFTYFDRNPSVDPLGVFAAQITSFQFTGKLNGNTLEIEQNPGMESTGQTAIGPVLPFNINHPMYDVNSYFAGVSPDSQPSQPRTSSICRLAGGISGGLKVPWERIFRIPSASA